MRIAYSPNECDRCESGRTLPVRPRIPDPRSWPAHIKYDKRRCRCQSRMEIIFERLKG